MSEPTSDDVTVHTIKHILFTGDADDKKVALVLTDGNDAAKAYAITPKAVSALLAPLISLATTWSGEPDLSKDGIGGTQNALPAKHILFAPGRNETECAVRVLIGRDIELTFLLPLADVMTTFQAFAQRIKFRPRLN